MMNKKFLDTILSDMCCSDCRTDFTADSVKIIRQEKDLYVVQIICTKCGKAFGMALFGNCADKNKNYADNDLVLEIQDGPDAINYDDVIDAHKFIQSLDADWQKHIPENLRK